MDNKINVWLYDMLNAIIEIESFFNDDNADFETYQRDVKTRRAVERNIEIKNKTGHIKSKLIWPVYKIILSP